MTKVVTNTKDESHFSLIQDLIVQSTEVWMSVAFLKQSGLSELKGTITHALQRGTIFKVHSGLDLYVTEPSALHQLHNWLKTDSRNELRIIQSRSQITFHPKIYCFHTSGRNVTIIVGSANLTSGGLYKNVELSILEHTTIDSDLYGEIKAFFETCENLKGAEIASELNISQYKRRFEIYREKISKANREAEEEIRSLKSLENKKILFYLKEYQQDKQKQEELAHRKETYEKARRILDMLLETPISSEKEFLSLYEQLVGSPDHEQLWVSGFLFRNKSRVSSNYEQFIEMLRKVNDNIEQPPEIVFGIGLQHLSHVKGAGVNILTEILHTYSSERFAVLNKNPLGALKYFGFVDFPSPASFKPETYVEYNELMIEIMELCGFDDTGGVDNFFDYIYWKYAREA